MLTHITNAQVRCVDTKVKIGGAEKTCKNFFDSAGQAQVICNRKKFMDNNEDQKYVLVHHEYAGLSGFETNKKDASKYALSNQITCYLQNTVVKRLVVKPLGVNRHLVRNVLRLLKSTKRKVLTLLPRLFAGPAFP